jgi:nitrate reductase gamma subunit
MSMFTWFIGGPLIYFAVALFIVKTLSTFIKYSKLPRHLRWDLYPVPHQGPEGSKYQKVDFGLIKPHISLFHELKEMGQEMLFIKKAYLNNPKVWKGSFPLHAGLYLGMAWLFLLAVGAMMELNGVSVTHDSRSVVAVMVSYATLVAGSVSFIAGLSGSLVLLWLRAFDEDMSFMSDAVSYLNLIVMIFLFGTGLAAWLFIDPSFQAARLHTADLLMFRPGAMKEPLMVLEILAFCSFLIYLPFSRMMHFVGKYFFYHNIMWDDEMMKRNSAMENDIAAYLQYKMTWAAPHIRKDGSWVDQVSEKPSKEGDSK